MTGQRLLFRKLAKRSPCGESRSPGWRVLRTKSVTWKTPRDYLVYEFVLSCVRTFSTLWIVAGQAPLSIGFSRQEFWSVLPFPPWGDLPEPGIKPTSCVAPTLAGRFLIAEPPGSPETIMEMSDLPHSQPLVHREWASVKESVGIPESVAMAYFFFSGTYKGDKG